MAAFMPCARCFALKAGEILALMAKRRKST